MWGKTRYRVLPKTLHFGRYLSPFKHEKEGKFRKFGGYLQHLGDIGASWQTLNVISQNLHMEISDL